MPSKEALSWAEKCGLRETGKQRGQEYQEKKTSGKTNLNLASLRKIENKLTKFKRGLP